MGDQPGNREESRMTCKPYDIPKTLIWEAWLHVKANQGAAGIDAETIERFEKKLGDNLYKLWNRMSSGSYVPPPVKAVRGLHRRARQQRHCDQHGRQRGLAGQRLRRAAVAQCQI